MDKLYGGLTALIFMGLMLRRLDNSPAPATPMDNQIDQIFAPVNAMLWGMVGELATAAALSGVIFLVGWLVLQMRR